MFWTRILTGPLSVLIGSVVVLPCIPINAHSDLKVEAPKIEDMVQHSDDKVYSITCRVKPGVLRDETLVYWLANDTFVEAVYKNDRVQTKASGDGTEYLETKLVFTKVVQEDFLTNFTCIALNPAGFDKRTTQLRVNV